MTTCGHCKTRGVTVQHVRDCAQIGRFQASQSNDTYPSLAKQPVEGIFKSAAGGIYKVQQGRTGNWYAKLLEMGAVNADGHEKFSWEYVGRTPLYYLTADMKLDADAAAQFGKATDRCIFCGLKLTDERSTTVGYGPKCAVNNSLPWR